MNNRTKLWAKYLFGALMAGAGAGISVAYSYKLGRLDGVESGASITIGSVYKAYGQEKGDEICKNAYDAIKDL